MMVDALNTWMLIFFTWGSKSYACFLGVLFMFTVFYYNNKSRKEINLRGKIYGVLSVPPLFVSTSFIAVPLIKWLGFHEIYFGNLKNLAFFVEFSILGVVLGVTTLRSGMQWFDKFRIKATVRTSQERNKKTDARTIDEHMPDPMQPYDVEKYFDLKKGTFLGIGEDKKPIYWPADKPTPHIQIAGTTGSGKGVFIGMIITQNIMQGEAVFGIDPKDDEYLCHVVATAARKNNKPYFYIDLNPTAPPQINFFAGATALQIEELFLAGFGLAEIGKSSDFYLIADREAAAFLAVEAAKPEATPLSLYNKFYELINNEMKAEKFAGYLKEMAAIPAVNAATGIDLRKVVQDGGAVYIRGSMRNSKVMRIQKMMVIKLVQLAEERDRTGNAKLRPISVVLDEFIYHISKPVLEALGAARDKGMHFTLAHQAFADFSRCGADLDKEAVKGAVVENCKLKLIYKLEDPETAEWMAQKSGKIQVDNETRKVEKNLALSETLSGDRTISQTQTYYIDEDVMMKLHDRLGIIFGIGTLAKFSYSSFVKTVKSKEDKICQTFENGATQPVQPSTTAPAEAWNGEDRRKAETLLEAVEKPQPSSFSLPALPTVEQEEEEQAQRLVHEQMQEPEPVHKHSDDNAGMFG